VDVRPSSKPCHSIVIQGDPQDFDKVVEETTNIFVDRIDAVFCVAGAWQGGSIGGTEGVMEVSRKMWEVNVEPSILAAQLAGKLNAKLVVLTGAKAVLHGTPEMLAYGMAKSAVVHLTKSLAADKQYTPTVACILPYNGRFISLLSNAFW